MFDLESEDYAATFVTVEECAKVMGISTEQVQRMVRLRLLRTRYPWGTLTV